MSNEINEMETTMEETYEPTFEPVGVYEGTVEDETKSGGGLGAAALLIAGGVALGGLAVKGIMALKNKNDDKPKKQKTKWKLMRVPVEDEDYEEEFEEVEVETIPEEDVTVEDTKK